MDLGLDARHFGTGDEAALFQAAHGLAAAEEDVLGEVVLDHSHGQDPRGAESGWKPVRGGMALLSGCSTHRWTRSMYDDAGGCRLIRVNPAFSASPHGHFRSARSRTAGEARLYRGARAVRR